MAKACRKHTIKVSSTQQAPLTTISGNLVNADEKFNTREKELAKNFTTKRMNPPNRRNHRATCTLRSNRKRTIEANRDADFIHVIIEQAGYAIVFLCIEIAEPVVLFYTRVYWR
ncbi:unnamed protein product [Toxocara canis]|uniref:Transmembrane protein n=1 Tax=Toxocara canis TaxID=6265 RepID=A0A183VCL3_TOXCA|nr:unnamed protein product [Toxocara canis]